MSVIPHILLWTSFIAFLTVAAIIDPAHKRQYYAHSYDGPNFVGEHCSVLRNLAKPRPLNLRLEQRHATIKVLWGRRAPIRATAGLMTAVFRHVLGYQKVELLEGMTTFCDHYRVVDEINQRADIAFDAVFIHMGLEWTSPKDDDCFTSAPAPSLRIGGHAPAASMRLFTHLAKEFIGDPDCLNYNSWSFYANKSALENCGFLRGLNLTDTCPQNKTCIKVMDLTGLEFDSKVVTELSDRALGSGVDLHIITGTRSSVNYNKSAVFIDFDVWSSNNDSVIPLQPPPCVFFCKDAIDPTILIKAADHKYLEQFAPLVERVLVNLTLDSVQIRQLLDLEDKLNDTLEAACAWATNNWNRIKPLSIANLRNLRFVKLVCQDDLDYKVYNNMTMHVVKEIKQSLNLPKTEWYTDEIDCHNSEAISQLIEDKARYDDFHELTGLVALGGAGGLTALAAAEQAKRRDTLLALYGLPPEDVYLDPATTAVTGRPRGLAFATQRFLHNHFWRRVGLISDRTIIANDFSAALQRDERLIIKEEKLETVDKVNIRKVLDSLIAVDARIFVVNADARTTGAIISTAHNLHMTDDTKYVWIVREWEPKYCEVKYVRVFSLSYAWRGSKGLSSGQNDTHILGEDRAELRAKIDKCYGENAWPLLSSSITDAMLSLAFSLSTALENDLSLLYNIHDYRATSNISTWASKNPDRWGVAQIIRLGSEPKFARVFVDEWHSSQTYRMLRGVWKVPDNVAGFLDVEGESFKVFETTSIPSDGTPHCLTALRGEPFTARCLDVAWASAVAIILLAPLLLLLAARLRRKRLARRERALHVTLLARCERTAEALRPLLVPRSALQLRDEELGVGHFGRVTLGLLRLPHRPPVAVAAKALRTNAAPAEEAEFLREGCALATLQHTHVVRLLGVCAADGPPLLLMEHAFYGDLLRYLQQRRHLAELVAAHELTEDLNSTSTYEDPETIYVSGPELARLAREAAAALAYLARRRYVHRDVRAANCLVHVGRTLKLADFGLARATNSESDKQETKNKTDTEESYAYICRRRGVFPVPWMAPESLERGVFSAASDVWALGVLTLEIATLGARPFGSWRPPRVLRYVKDGGRPPLPRDASYHLSEIADMCWARNPSRRASAETIRRYLTTAPLRPALPSCLDDDSADSGFGERDTNDWLPAEPHISTC